MEMDLERGMRRRIPLLPWRSHSCTSNTGEGEGREGGRELEMEMEMERWAREEGSLAHVMITRLSVMAHVQPFTSELDDKVRNICFIVGIFFFLRSSSEESSLSCLLLQR